MIRLLVLPFCLLLASNSAAANSEWLAVSDLRAIYSDGTAVDPALTNKSTDTVRVRIDIQQLNGDGTWQDLYTQNKAIMVVELKPNEARRIEWKFWEDRFTFEYRVLSGTYRLELVHIPTESGIPRITTVSPTFRINRGQKK